MIKMSEENLIIDNMGLIGFVIKKLKIRYFSIDEYQEYFDSGLEGLIKGAKTYDSSKNIQVSTYLTKCIKNEILRHIVSKNYKKNKNESGKDISLETIIYKSGSNILTLYDTIQDERVNILEQSIKKSVILDILEATEKKLKEREKMIFKDYYGLNNGIMYSTREIAKKTGISDRRVYMILKTSERKIKDYLKYKKKYEEIK